MKFEEAYRIICCKDDSYRIEFDNNEFYFNKKLYYKGYLVHRVNNPAIECIDGFKEWWLNGKLHHEGGPAIEYDNGRKKWYLNGKEYSEQKYLKIINLKKKSQVLDEI